MSRGIPSLLVRAKKIRVDLTLLKWLYRLLANNYTMKRRIKKPIKRKEITIKLEDLKYYKGKINVVRYGS